MKYNILAIYVFLLLSFCNNKSASIYKDSSKPLEDRVEDLLKQMSLDEKVLMLSGVNTFETVPNERLGIPVLKMTDGPLGVKENNPTAFPSGICMAATWDTSLLYDIGKAIGIEAKQCGRNVVLGPTVNIHRIPGGGRNFESFGEDPYLASRMGVNYIKGLQNENVVATVKHFACNNQEYDRLATSSEVDERTLNEIYYPAFKVAVQEANCLAVMGAYNKVNGFHACDNHHLLTEILKGKWGFKGIAMSDWGAVHGCISYLNAGLDIEMPGGEFMKKDTILKAIKENKIQLNLIDDQGRRLLRVMFTIGLFDKKVEKEEPIDKAFHKDAAYKTAAGGIVLLKNESKLLPVKAESVKSIAVIGPNAAIARTGGGGSSFVPAPNAVSPFEALKSKLEDKCKIEYAQGCFMDDKLCTVVPSECLQPSGGKVGVQGLKGEYFDNISFEGKPALVRIDEKINFGWGDKNDPLPSKKEDFYSVRWSGFLKPNKSGNYMLSIQSDDGTKLFLNDKMMVDNWSIQGVRSKFTITKLEAGKSYPVKIEFFENTGYASVKFSWYLLEDTNLEKQAVDLAKKSDMAIIFAGLSSESESEGWDYYNLKLPAGQDELIKAVSAANKNTIVVLFGGIGLDVQQWIKNVPAVIQAWYPGQECGNVLADILCGDINPSGRLPVTFVKSWEKSPAYGNYPGKDGKVNYAEGIFVGYRYFDKNPAGIMFPFGHGLSYTNFEYKSLNLSKSEFNKDETVEASLVIKNTGQSDGSEVVQLYIQPIDNVKDRPIKELKHFTKIFLKKGEEKPVKITISANDFAFYDISKHDWIIPDGKYKVLIGSSSRDIRLEKLITIL